MNVEAVLDAKGRRVVTVRPEASISVAAQLMKLEKVGALVVGDNRQPIAGLITERDIVHGFAQRGTALEHMRVVELMMRNVPVCAPGDGLRQIMTVMTRRRTRHMPVVEGGRLAGLVSMGDVVKNLLDELELERGVLRDILIARQ